MHAALSKMLPVALIALGSVGCPPPTVDGSAGVRDGAALDLAGVDTSTLTAREKREWQSYVTELLAPCPEVAVSIAECVAQQRPCAACLPAARFVMQQVRAGRPRSQVFDLFELRFQPDRVRTIVVGDSATSGPAAAPVTIVEFSDFQCPSCERMSAVLDALLALFPDEVRLVYKHYPISYHTHAHISACAAVAAQKQGKFWAMHQACFANPDRLTEGDLRGYAAAIGLDVDRFGRDLHAEHVIRQVDRERKQGEGLGVKGTPTLYINGREVPLGALDDPLRDLKQWIEVEIELVRGAGPAGAGRRTGEHGPTRAERPSPSVARTADPPPSAPASAAPDSETPGTDGPSQ